MRADLILHNSIVRTLNRGQPTAEAVVARAGQIVFVGDNSRAMGFKGPGTRVIDLAGKALLPGFIDAHQHQLYMGLSSRHIDLRPGAVESIHEIVSLVADQASTVPETDWIEGYGFNDARLVERRNPTRDDLDRATGRHPVLMTRACGHLLAVNSRALELAGITRDTPDPPGGTIARDPATREPTGVLRETAMALVRRVLPVPNDSTLRQAILEGAATNLRHGITSVWEPSIEPDHLRVYRALDADQRLPLRVTLAHKKVLRNGEVVALPRPFVGSMLSLVAIKLFQDGGFGGATAALSEPYTNEPDSTGQLIWSQTELTEWVREIEEAGLGISIHAIGDAAIRSVLDAFNSLRGSNGTSSLLRIEHCGLPLPPLPDQIAQSGVILVMQPTFLWFDGDVYLDRVGPERSRWLYPIRTLLAHGIHVAGSSDGPVVPDVNPLLGVYAAVTRMSKAGRKVAPEEAISLHEALSLFTLGAAYACGQADDRGSIKPGKMADMVVLGADPFAVPVETLPDIPVERVFVGGREVQSAST